MISGNMRHTFTIGFPHGKKGPACDLDSMVKKSKPARHKRPGSVRKGPDFIPQPHKKPGGLTNLFGQSGR